MRYKILLFIGILGFFLINFNNLSADNLNIIPLKKPILSNEEISKKLSKNILKPIKKPKKIKEKKVLSKEKETNGMGYWARQFAWWRWFT